MKKELEIKDVMVGDWVDVRNNAAPNTPHLERITPSHFLRDEHWYGVELVPEILEKNGFVGILSDCGIDYSSEVYKLRIIRRRNDEGWTIYANHFGFDKKDLFVHELQHALRLCGIEKEIEL